MAEFTNNAQRHDRLPVTINPLTHDDIVTCAQLAAAREGEPVDPFMLDYWGPEDEEAQG